MRSHYMNRFTGYTAGLLCTLFFLMAPSFAKSSVRIPQELAGTQQVMKLLGKVNIPRLEQRAQQGAVDILEFKSQLYNQSPMLHPGVTGLSAAGKVSSPAAGYKRQLPHRRRLRH